MRRHFPLRDTPLPFQPDISYFPSLPVSSTLLLSLLYLYRMKHASKISEEFWIVWFTPTAWLKRSKLLTNPQAKLPENSLQPRRLVSVPLLPVESRSLIAIVLALLPSVKFVSIKKHRISVLQSTIPALTEGNYTVPQRRLPFSIFGIAGITGSLWGIPCWNLWGFKLVCHPCQEDHHHA